MFKQQYKCSNSYKRILSILLIRHAHTCKPTVHVCLEMSQVTWISVFCMCIAIIECSDKHAKRLLLNDPDVVEKRFNQLELEIQNLKSEVVSLKTESQQKTARISQLEAGQSSSGN